MPRSLIVKLRFDPEMVGGFLWGARSGSKLSLSAMSALSGTSRTHIRHIEGGGGVTIEKLVALSSVLGIAPWTPLFHSVYAEVDPADLDLAADTPQDERRRIARVIESAMMIIILPSEEERRPYCDLAPDFLAALAEECDSCGESGRFDLARSLQWGPVSFLATRGFFGEIVKSVKESLTLCAGQDTAESAMQGPSLWQQLLNRLAPLLAPYGAQARLARELGVTRQAVSQWLRGVGSPTAETSLRLNQWVTQNEGKKNPGSVRALPGQTTQTTKNKANEKRGSGRQGPT